MDRLKLRILFGAIFLLICAQSPSKEVSNDPIPDVKEKVTCNYLGQVDKMEFTSLVINSAVTILGQQFAKNATLTGVASTTLMYSATVCGTPKQLIEWSMKKIFPSGSSLFCSLGTTSMNSLAWNNIANVSLGVKVYSFSTLYINGETHSENFGVNLTTPNLTLIEDTPYSAIKEKCLNANGGYSVLKILTENWIGAHTKVEINNPVCTDDSQCSGKPFAGMGIRCILHKNFPVGRCWGVVKAEGASCCGSAEYGDFCTGHNFRYPCDYGMFCSEEDVMEDKMNKICKIIPTGEW